MERKIHTIDAKGRVLGRLATIVANLLRGKTKPEFSPEKDLGDFVVIKNASQIKLTGSKLKTKIYYHHTGYPGGLKEITLEKLFQKDPKKVIQKAVAGMLPKNKLRKIFMKRLKIEL